MCLVCIDGLPSALYLNTRSWALAKFLAPSLFTRDGTVPLTAMSIRNMGATSCDPLFRPIWCAVSSRDPSSDVVKITHFIPLM